MPSSCAPLLQGESVDELPTARIAEELSSGGVLLHDEHINDDPPIISTEVSCI